jgi:predicted phosphodiesterase
MKRKADKTILVISDPHFPFEAKDFMLRMKEAKKEFHPDIVVCTGDLVDQHGLGRWTPDSDAMGNIEELNDARECILRLGVVFPDMLVCYGNHDLRFLRKIKSVGIPSAFARDFREVIGAPKGWDFDMAFEIDNVVYFHGDGFSGEQAASAAVDRYRKSVVMGHVHAFASVVYKQGPTDMVWGMNAGCLIDPKSMAFAYGKNYPHKPVIGFGVVVNGVPHFIPFN